VKAVIHSKGNRQRNNDKECSGYHVVAQLDPRHDYLCSANDNVIEWRAQDFPRHQILALNKKPRLRWNDLSKPN
jgi:hypothetical protein